MRTSAVVAAAVLASGASAQFIPTSSSTLSLLNSLSALLTPSCRTAVQSLVAPNSTFAQCLNLDELVPALSNNQSSIIPNIDAYLRSTCAQPACSDAVLQNATQSIATGCRQDLSSFGIDSNYTRYFAEYYETGRDVLCLSTNDTELLPNSTFSSNTTRNNTILCPTSLLSSFETYIGSPLSNSFIINTALGGNATAWRRILDIPRNATLIREFACNDCVAASVEIVLEDVPQLRNASIVSLTTANLNNYTGLGVAGNRSEWSLPQFYDAICPIDLTLNGTLPASINETAYDNTTSIISSASRVSTVAAASSSASLVSRVSSVAAVPVTSVVSRVSAASSLIASGIPTVTQVAPTQVITPAARRRFVRWD